VEVNVVLDTNAYSEMMRGIAARTEVVEDASHVYLPLFVLAELRAGFTAGRLAGKNERQLLEFLSQPQVSVLLPDDETSHHYARLHAYLKAKGRPIPTHDLWIAALVVQHGLILCTADTHFDHLPQIPKC
jgi:tRNA(fMet)-specific endonuclease VapC